MRLLLVAATFVLSAGSAQAFCPMVPSAPRSPGMAMFVSKPSPPICMSSFSYSKTHDCDDFQVRSYLSEVERYVETLATQAQDAVEFSEKAAEYADAVVENALCERKAALDALR